MANSVGAETPRKRYVTRSKPPALNSSTRMVVAPACGFESPQGESPGKRDASGRLFCRTGVDEEWIVQILPAHDLQDLAGRSILPRKKTRQDYRKTQAGQAAGYLENEAQRLFIVANECR